MASLTIRKLDDAIRDELRLRAARNGRSVEDEVRVILRDASQHGPSLAASFPASP
jgi:phosphopantothenoylcysteine decarboxylase/phosphopantothenate--cysteine ligase